MRRVPGNAAAHVDTDGAASDEGQLVQTEGQLAPVVEPDQELLAGPGHEPPEPGAPGDGDTDTDPVAATQDGSGGTASGGTDDHDSIAPDSDGSSSEPERHAATRAAASSFDWRTDTYGSPGSPSSTPSGISPVSLMRSRMSF